MLYSFALLLPCSVCLFWAITLFYKRKTNNRPQNIWIAGALVMSISTYIWSVFFAGIDDYRLFYKLELIEAFTTLLTISLLFLCFKALTSEKPFGWKEYSWFIPAILIGGSMTMLYVVMGDAQAAAYIRELSENQGKIITFTAPVFRIQNLISVYIYGIVVLLQITYLLIYATIRLIRYRHRLNEFFSNNEGKSLENGTAMLVTLYVILLLSLVTYKGRFHYNEPSISIAILMVVWAAIIYYMGHNIYQLKYTAQEFAYDLAQADHEAAENGYALPEKGEFKNLHTENNEKQIELLHAFNKIMNEEKVFLQKDLRISDIALAMRTNRTYISRMINEEYQCTFSDLISRKRIEYALELMQAYPGRTQDQIAEQSGFAYASYFSHIFKQQTGMTFRQWHKKQSNV